MPRRVKDFIDISEFTSLDDLIRYLQTIRDNLPEGCKAEMKIRGDEVFGKRLTIQYFREQSAEEAELRETSGPSNQFRTCPLRFPMPQPGPGAPARQANR